MNEKDGNHNFIKSMITYFGLATQDKIISEIANYEFQAITSLAEYFEHGH